MATNPDIAVKLGALTNDEQEFYEALRARGHEHDDAADQIFQARQLVKADRNSALSPEASFSPASVESPPSSALDPDINVSSLESQAPGQRFGVETGPLEEGLPGDISFEALGGPPRRTETEEPPIPSAGPLVTAKDIGIKLAQGVVDVGQAVIGLGSLATGGKFGELMGKIGYDPQATNEYLGEYLSDAQKQSEQAVAEAEGFVDSLAAYIAHPRAAMGQVVESIPSTIGMGAPGRLLAERIATRAAAPLGGLTTKVGAEAAKAAVEKAAGKLIWTGAAAEGLTQTGQLAQEAQAAGREFTEYAIPSVVSGLVDAAIAGGAGKLIGDPLTALFTGAKRAGATGGYPARVLKSIFSEGVLEELPQSAQEQIFHNVAMGKPWDEGVGRAGAAGLVTGGIMGGGMAAVTRGIAPPPTPITPRPTGGSPPTIEEQIGKTITAVNPVLTAQSVDQAITSAGKAIEGAPITAGQLDQFISSQAESEVTYASDQATLLDLFRDQPTFAETSPGKATWQGAPLQVVAPTALPIESDQSGRLTRGQYDALAVALSAEGKRLVVFQSHPAMEGVARKSLSPNTVFIGETTDADPMTVAYHEVSHLMRETPLHRAFAETMIENLSPKARQLARERHGTEVSEEELLDEMAADIYGDAMSNPKFMSKVVRRMQEQIGPAETKAVTVGFLDTIKNLIAKVRGLIARATFKTPDGKSYASQYVNNLTKVHDALAEAVADVYVTHRKAGEKPSAEATKLALSRREEADFEIVPPEAITEFRKLASAQRGEPETAMIQVQEALGGGVLGPVVEHAGDLTHRMTSASQWGVANRPYVQEKIDRVLSALTHPYGFEKELEENLRNNARYFKQPVEERRARVEGALKKYADEHRKLTVYNLPQWLGREAAVAIGEKKFDKAAAFLKELKALADSPTFTREALSVERDENGKIRPYLRPLGAKSIGIQEDEFGGFELFNLEEKAPGEAVGSTVTRASMEQRGYRLVPTGILTPAEAKTRARLSKKGLVIPEEIAEPELRKTLSTTVPYAKKTPGDAYRQNWIISGDSIRASAQHVKTLTNVLREYPMMIGKGTREEVMQEFHRKMVNNILWFYDLVPEPIRVRARQWYRGANRIATEWAMKNGYSVNQNSGIIAVMSPQKDWFTNVSVAERLWVIMKEHQNTEWTSEMTGWTEAYRDASITTAIRKLRNQLVMAALDLEGTPLANLNDRDAASFIRAFDETYHDRTHRLVTPEGGFGELVMTENETQEGRASLTPWGSTQEIAKAVSILRDGSNKNIDQQLGKGHKVRNFYNNVLDPESKEGHVTIDSHAMGAALVKALSLSSPEIKHIQPHGRGGQNAMTGAEGSYGLVADAYREAAKKREVLPNELQAVVWEAVRGLFPSSIKDQLAPKIEIVWDEVREGKLSLEAARERIFTLSGGIRKFAWQDGGEGLSPANGGTSFTEGGKDATITTRSEELRQPGRVRGTEGLLAFARRPYQSVGKAGDTLIGLPRIVSVNGIETEFEAFKPAQDAARAYMEEAGLPYRPETIYHKLNKERGKRIADAYDALVHNPQDPAVNASYRAMIDETIAQFKAILKTGLVVEFNNGEDPYGNPRNAILDVVENNHLFVFSTRDGFGSNQAFDPKNNPLLEETPFKFGDKPTVANDIFRVVHDYFGHIKEGNGFRAEGEDNAWYSHAAMYSDLARPAMTTETRGQNSWVNFGPQSEKNRNASSAETVYADQKTALLPDWAMEKDVPIDLSFSPKRPPFGLSKAELPKNAVVPKVKWDKDSARATAEQIQDDYRLTFPPAGTPFGVDLKPVVYQAYVPIEDVPRPRMIDLDEYSWKDYRFDNVFPPATISLHPNGVAKKLDDGNHRVRFWQEKGFTHIPAWIVDWRKDVTERPKFATRTPAVKRPTTTASVEPTPVWVSTLTRTLEEKLPSVASKEQARNIITSGAIKQDEIKWSGILDYIDRQRSEIKKNNLLKWLNLHRVQVQEVVKGEGAGFTEVPEELDISLQEFNRQWGDNEPQEPDPEWLAEQRESTGDPNWQPDMLDYDTISRHRDFPVEIHGQEGMGYEVSLYNEKGGAFLGNIDTRGDLIIGGTGLVFKNFNKASEQAYEYLIAEPRRQIEKSQEGMEAKFQGYKLPGGSGYTELLLTLPQTRTREQQKAYDRWQAYLTTLKEKYGEDVYQYRSSVGEARHRIATDQSSKKRPTSEELKQLESLHRQANFGGLPVMYASPHWDEANILAHVRFDERTDERGKRILFLEEVQSDWHERGREAGYKTADMGAQIDALDKHAMALRYKVEKTLESLNHLGFDAMHNAKQAIIDNEDFTSRWQIPEKDRPLLEEYAQTRREHRRLVNALDIAPPDAPFSKTWHELVMKRMLRWAAEKNYDTLAWTTGQQQNERYNLAKSGVEIRSYQTESEKKAGTYSVLIYSAGGRTVWSSHDATIDSLIPVIGKELTQKIVNREGTIPPDDSRDIRELSGLDLEIGGEGMKYFYDKMLPRFMEKYVKRWGVSVKDIKIDFQGPGETIYSGPQPTLEEIKHLHMRTSFYSNLPAALQGQFRDVETAMLRGERLTFKQAIEKHGSIALAEKFGGKLLTLPGLDEVPSVDITPEMKESVMRGQPMFAPRRPAGYTVEQPGRLDSTIRLLQDKNIDIKRLVESIRAAGLTVPDDLDPVLKEEVYQKRSEQRSADFKNDELVPLLTAMRLNQVTTEHMDRFLHARHVIADRVNERLQAINPDLPDNTALSGMSDDEARTILAQANRPLMETLAARVDSMVNQTRELMVEYGLESRDMVNSWSESYRAYVPLRREGFEEEGHPTGTGRSVRGSTVHPRLGSGLGVTNILANVAQARDQIITRGEKMKPVVAFAGLMMLHPNSEIATLDKPARIMMTDPATGLIETVPGDLAEYKVPRIRRFDPRTGTVQSYPDPSYKGRDNVVNFRIEGIDYAIVFNDRNERALEIAKALKELDTGKLTGIMKSVAPYTRYLASINTQYNPIFGVINFVRDAQFAMLTLSSTPLAGRQREVFTNAVKSLSGIYADARAIRRGEHPRSPTAQMWERFQHVGGPTGYRDIFFKTEDRAREIDRLLNPKAWSTIRTPGDLARRMEETPLFQWLSDYNLTMENAIRLGVFKTAIDHGISELRAASLAKNITVNFNKKGQIGAQMGSLYAFFNANVQGTARIMETLLERTPTGRVTLTSAGKKIVAGGILIGVLQTFALAMGGFDDQDPPEYLKQKNIIIPAPGTDKGYVMIPMPLGFNLLPNIGRLATEALWYGKPITRAFSLFGAMFNSLSPTGGAGGLIQELAPTVADPFVALEANKDWTGRAISREDVSTLRPTPGFTRARDTATWWARGLSYAINWATGGTDYTPGVLSPTPDAIDYLIQQATGGVGREVSKAAQVVQGAYTGEDVPLFKVPLAGRFVGTATGKTAIRQKFYDNLKAVNLAAEEVIGRAKHGEDFVKYMQRHPYARLEKAANQVERQLGELNQQKRDLIKKGAGREAVKLKEEQISSMMERFNTVVAESQK